MSWCASAPTPTCWSSVPVSRSGARRYLAGSVSHYCISHASCPVVTVPEPWPNPQHDLSGHSTRHHDTAVAAAV